MIILRRKSRRAENLSLAFQNFPEEAMTCLIGSVLIHASTLEKPGRGSWLWLRPQQGVPDFGRNKSCISVFCSRWAILQKFFPLAPPAPSSSSSSWSNVKRIKTKQEKILMKSQRQEKRWRCKRTIIYFGRDLGTGGTVTQEKHLSASEQGMPCRGGGVMRTCSNKKNVIHISIFIFPFCFSLLSLLLINNAILGGGNFVMFRFIMWLMLLLLWWWW